MDHGAGTGVQGNNLLWVLRDLRHRTTDAFELWGWRWLFKASWTARRSNQSTLKEISPEYALEGLILSWNSSTLAIWCEELTHWKRPWCWERLKAGGEGDHRGWEGWMTSPSRWTWVWASSKSWWWTRKPGMLLPMGSKESGTTERLTELGSLCQKSRTEIGMLFTYSFMGWFCVCVCSVAKLCLILCDSMDCSMPDFPLLHYLPEFAQVHVH